MNIKNAIKSKTGTRIGVILLGILFLLIFSHTSTIFGTGDVPVLKPTEKKEVVEKKQPVEIVRTENSYTVSFLAEDKNKTLQRVEFKVDPQMVDSLGFTEAEIGDACLAATKRARAYVETFVYNGTPELKMVGGNPMVIIPVIISEEVGNDMFISGKVTKSGQALPMRSTIKDPSIK